VQALRQEVIQTEVVVAVELVAPELREQLEVVVAVVMEQHLVLQEVQ
jgi:hypothetical protein